MANLFLKILNMSISASWIVIAVLLFRFLFKKAPKWINVVLWGVVGLRLIMPFSFESVLSLIPSTEIVSPTIMMDKTPQIDIGIDVVNNAINPIITGSFAPEPMASANPLQIIIPVISNLWLLGVAILLVYSIISYLRLKFKIGTAILYNDNIYQSENVASPFVLGIIKPKIYLPFNIDEQDMSHVIAHERAHIKRKDYLWKPIGFLLLTLHWFNPLMWIGYILLCRDIELACDQKVINELTNEQKADYSQALLTCSVNRRLISACPLAFGEVGVKDRVKSVLNYKKPAFWIIIAALITSIALAVCFLTDPAVTTLKNIENSNLESISKTATVFVADDEIYRSIGSVDNTLLQQLSNLKISKKEISLDRSQDRDATNALVLQTRDDETHTYISVSTTYSYLEGLYIYFNSDFTSVWVNDGVKPTLSYKVIKPKKAKEIFESISSFSYSNSTVGGVDDSNVAVKDKEKIEKKELVIPELRKDGKITKKISEQFFNFATYYRIDCMPEVKNGKLTGYEYGPVRYAVHMCTDEIIEYKWDDTSYTLAMPVSTVKRLTKEVFNIDNVELPSYDKYVPQKAESLTPYPFCKVVEYSQKNTDEGTLVSARLAQYLFFEYLEGSEEYNAAKKEVIAGTANDALIYDYINIEYLIDKKGSLIKFVSCAFELNPNYDPYANIK